MFNLFRIASFGVIFMLFGCSKEPVGVSKDYSSTNVQFSSFLKIESIADFHELLGNLSEMNDDSYLEWLDLNKIETYHGYYLSALRDKEQGLSFELIKQKYSNLVNVEMSEHDDAEQGGRKVKSIEVEPILIGNSLRLSMITGENGKFSISNRIHEVFDDEIQTYDLRKYIERFKKVEVKHFPILTGKLNNRTLPNQGLFGWESCSSLDGKRPSGTFARDKCDQTTYDKGTWCKKRRLIGETFSIVVFTLDQGIDQAWEFEQKYKSYSCKKFSGLSGDHTITYNIAGEIALVYMSLSHGEPVLKTARFSFDWNGISDTSDDTISLIWSNTQTEEALGPAQAFAYAYNTSSQIEFHYKKRGANNCTPSNMHVEYSLP